MLNFLKKTANQTYTENGASTHATTNSDCLDLFATIGALRRESDYEIITRFMRAYNENPDLAMKLLFFARDIRGGLGERRVFRVILNWLAQNHPESVNKNIENVEEYGRFDDLISLLNTPCEKAVISYFRFQLEMDLESLKNGESVSLFGKWLPSVNASSPETVAKARYLARAFGMSEAEYRKTLTKLRAQIRIIENNLREMDYTFDYEKQPSKALFKYRKAFMRNDEIRYEAFLNQVDQGEAKLNTSTLYPYEIISPLLSRSGSTLSTSEKRSINTTWNAQRDFTNGENALVVVDGSGSMYNGVNPLPITVALSLGIYFAERNQGIFKNHFITFSTKPQLVEIKGKDIASKVDYCKSFNEMANTDIQKVFELILETAVRYSLPQKELPTTLYIISDMEFDSCSENASMTNFEYAKKLYQQNGYALPQVVFWNVSSRNRQQPVATNDQGVALVSGASPQIFSMLEKGILSPYAFMLDTLYTERYYKITA